MNAADVEYFINISLANRYIYVETPKCACSTIKLTLHRTELRDPDFSWNHSSEIHLREFSPLLSPFQVGSFRKLLADESYFKFCFVRHPYSRLLSAYLDKVTGWPEYRMIILRQLHGPDADPSRGVSFAEFVTAVCGQEYHQMDCHWRPQYYITMQELLQYDFVGRFERFEADFYTIGDRIAPSEFARYFRSDLGHATGADAKLDQYLTDELSEMIYDKFRIDFDCFGFARSRSGPGERS